MRWILSLFFPRQYEEYIIVPDLCHRLPHWCYMVNTIESLDHWKVVVQIMFEDGKNERERFQVLKVFYQDVTHTLILKRKTRVALQIQHNYMCWQISQKFI